MEAPAPVEAAVPEPRGPSRALTTIRDCSFLRHSMDLTTGEVHEQQVQCEDLEDVIGGTARGLEPSVC